MLSSAQEPRRKGAIMALLALLTGSSGALFVTSLYPISASDNPTPQPFLMGIIILSILVADLVSFKLRTGALRISLILAALVPATLLLPTSWALIAAMTGLTLSALGRQVNLLRGIYDVWSGTFATALMLLTYHTLAGEYQVDILTPSFLELQPILAVLAAAGVHALLTFYLAFAFRKVLNGGSYEEYVSSNATSYFWGALASSLLGALIVAVAASAPILLPLTILPAWAIARVAKSLIYSRQADARTSQVSEVAKLLNSNLEPVALVESFLELSRHIHGSSVAVAIHELEGETEVLVVGSKGTQRIEATPEIIALLDSSRAGQDASVISHTHLPQDWKAGLIAPLNLDGVHYGAALLGWYNPTPEVELDLPLWSSLTAALGSALSQAALFAQIEAITASQSEAVIALSESGGINFLNPAAQKLLGVDGSFTRGMNVDTSLKVGSNVLNFKDLAALKMTNAPVEYRDAILLGDKDLVVNCTVSPMRSSRSASSDWMSKGVVVVIEDRTASRAAARALAESQEQIMALGRALQASLLPAALPSIEGATLAARYHAADGGLDIGGDFYDVLNTRDDSYNIIMGDVCGRGPEAAALTSLTRHTLRGAVGTDPSPVSALRRLNEAVVSESENMFCTVAMGRITAPIEGRSTLVVTLGGHPPVIVIRKDGKIEEIAPEGTLIGAFEEINLSEERVELSTGDAVVFYTDGVLEARGPDGAFFESTGLNSLLASQAGLGAEAIAESLDAALKEFQGGILQDDTAFIILSVD